MTVRIGTIPIMAVMVASVACSSASGLPAVSGPTWPRIEVVATEMRYTPSTIAVEHGDVEVVLRNEGLVIHDLHVEDGKPRMGLEAGPGRTSTVTWKLDKGRYRISCFLAGHKAAGMEGILEVR